jgi:hypothetical protein
MKYIIPALALSICFLSTACNNSSDEDKTEDKVLPVVSNPADNNKPAGSDNIQPTHAVTNATLPATPVNAPVTTAAGINPEHGKPGHRCDIAVGAPLTTQPATTTSVSPTTSKTTLPAPTVVNSTKPATTTTSAAGLNPEHGKPGHRCDIAVGAPLTGQPATTTQPAATVTPVTKQPAPLAPVLPAASVAPGMNPEHGKPGHRCDIAVGAPLTSKPKQ